MNKNTTISIVIVAILILGGIGFFMMNKKSSTSVSPQTNNSQTQSEQKSALKSLKDLLISGVAQKCSYSDPNESGVSGSTYVSNGKIRNDFTSKMDNKTISGHMIVDGKVSYMWTDDQTTGIKMAFDPSSQSNNPNPNSNDQKNFDTNKAMNFECSSWPTDNSVFTPPTTVKFMDTSAMVPAKGTTTAPTANQCAACDYLSGDDKTQCLSALKCN